MATTKTQSLSVTKYLATLTSPFQPRVVAGRMIQGRKWHRKRTQAPYAGRVPQSAQAPRQAQIEAILRVWDEERKAGISLHSAIEKFYQRGYHRGNGQPGSESALSTLSTDPGFGLFLTWQRCFERDVLFAQGWELAGSEMKVNTQDPSTGQNKYRLHGIIDAVYTKTVDNVRYALVFDFKRCTGLLEAGHPRYQEYFQGPHFCHLPTTKRNKYSLQLALYAFMLEHYHDCHVVGLFLVGLHPSKPKPFLVRVRHHRPAVEAAMAERATCP